MDIEAAGDLLQGLTGIASGNDFQLLMMGQFRLMSELDTLGHRPDAAFAGALHDEFAFELGQSAQHRHH